MNIQQAKEEIVHTVRAYLQKDEEGAYCFPAVQQRPLLLMGPPGIGKTAIMEQAAAQCGVPIYEYTPMQIKLAVTGNGHADKKQVQQMVKLLLNLKTVPKPDDAADALGAAICHANTAEVSRAEFRIK